MAKQSEALFHLTSFVNRSHSNGILYIAMVINIELKVRQMIQRRVRGEAEKEGEAKVPATTHREEKESPRKRLVFVRKEQVIN